MMNADEMMEIEEGLDFEEVKEPTELTDLGWMGDAIAANNHRAKMIKEYRDARIEKIKATCEQALERLAEDSARLEGMAFGVMKAHGYCYDDKNLRKYVMPDVGTFRFSVTRESVDTSEFDAFEPKDRMELQNQHPAFFNRKVVVSPNKKAIAEELKQGTDCEGFKLKPKFEKFEFKGE